MPPKKQKLGSIGQQLFEIGKLQPQAVDLEEAVLGACMLEKEILPNIIDILTPQCFYKEAHGIIWRHILAMYHKSLPIDILTVTNSIKASGELELVGGAYGVSVLTNRVSSGANTEFHSRIILQKFISRELIRTSTETIRMCYEDSADVFEMLDKAQTHLTNITSDNVKAREQDSTAIFGDLIKHIERASLNKEELTGVPCTIKEVNKLTNGWQPSDLIIIAGRPAMGKTAFTKSCIKGAIDYLKKPVLMFSIEMSTLQLSSRLLSEDVGVASKPLLSGKIEGATNFSEINSKVTRYFSDDHKPLLFIDDTPSITINELRANAKRIHRKHGICLIIVDYLQKVKGSKEDGNRVQEVEEVTWGLKALAKELNIPVIALSQLSRATEKDSKEKRPNLSHLRESGAIEQDADIVGFLYRPEYYANKIDEGDMSFKTVNYKGQDISSEGYAELIIEKHRNGGLGSVAMKFIDRLTKFQDWEDGDYRNDNLTGTSTPVEPPEGEGSSHNFPQNNDFLKQKGNGNIGGNDFKIVDPPF